MIGILLPLLADLAAGAVPPRCPGSPVYPFRASSEVNVVAAASCATVKEEILSRVEGQGSVWVDPHNNGTYSVESVAGAQIELSRITGRPLGWMGWRFTDRLMLTLWPGGDEVCEIAGCSESQGLSFGDLSTNYCNLRMLYCGSRQGCSPVKHDFTIAEQVAETSIGATTNPTDCLVLVGQSHGGEL